MPDLPPPSLTLDDIDRVMNRDDLRPPQVAWKVLDAGSYEFSKPGMRAPIRVTTRPAIFDEHFESHEFLGPGNRLYDELVQLISDSSLSTPTTVQTGDSEGHHASPVVEWVAGSGPSTPPITTFPGFLQAVEQLGIEPLRHMVPGQALEDARKPAGSRESR